MASIDRVNVDDAIAVIRSCPATARHRIDYGWRLSSPYWQHNDDAQLFGTDAAFAVWQRPWAVLDVWVRPGAASVMPAVLDWAGEHFAAIAHQRLPYWIEADPDRLELLDAYGYTLTDDSYVQLRHDLAELPQLPTPRGFHIRPLADDDDYVAVHKAAFDGSMITGDWRAASRTMPNYRADCDLVAVADSGEVAGFCLCWYDESLRVGHIEPLGVHPNYRRRGIAQALLNQALRRVRRHGARSALVEPTRGAQRAYEMAGFRQARSIIRRGRWFGGIQFDCSARAR